MKNQLLGIPLLSLALSEGNTVREAWTMVFVFLVAPVVIVVASVSIMTWKAKRRRRGRQVR